jgi:hypothetical protein
VTFNNIVCRTTIGSRSPAKTWWFLVSLLSRVRHQTTLANSEISEARCESALADSSVLVRRVANCTFYLRALIHYHNDYGCFFMLRSFKLKWIVWRIARQWLGKHIQTGAKARNNRTSIARQRRNKHLSSTTEPVSAWSVPRSFLEESCSLQGSWVYSCGLLTSEKRKLKVLR